MASLVPRAELRPSGWTREEWMDRYVGRAPGDIAALYPRLVGQITEFVADANHR